MEPEEESGCIRGTYQMILFASLLKSASLIFRNHSESGHPGWFCLHVLSSRFSQLLLNLDTAGTLNRRKSLVSHFKIQAKCARPWERLKMLIWVFLESIRGHNYLLNLCSPKGLFDLFGFALRNLHLERDSKTTSGRWHFTYFDDLKNLISFWRISFVLKGNCL